MKDVARGGAHPRTGGFVHPRGPPPTLYRKGQDGCPGGPGSASEKGEVLLMGDSNVMMMIIV